MRKRLIKDIGLTTVITASLLCSGCAGIGRYIEGPDDFDRAYYSPEKQRIPLDEPLQDIFGDDSFHVFHKDEPVTRYPLQATELPEILKDMPGTELECKVEEKAEHYHDDHHHDHHGHSRQNGSHRSPPLSPGDRVQIYVHEGEEFSGVYEVNIDGTLGLALIDPIYVAGLTAKQAEALIKHSFLEHHIYKKANLHVSVRPQQWAAVQVQVMGAVFNPGLVTINARKAEDRAQQSTQVSGDFSTSRLLSSALQAAGGIRPDANLTRVIVVRNNRNIVFDISGVLDGSLLNLPALAAGDRIFVPSTGFFDSRLVRPSGITPPGVRIFISNLTQPATDNASSAIGKHATSIPYGTRLLSAAVSANCVGGSSVTNSNRTAVLISKNPVTGESEIIERPIEKLITNRKRDTYNPHIMPDDAIACYDSGVTDLREIGRTFTDLLVPFALF